MRDYKVFSAFVLLLLFFLKSSAFHVYTHDFEHSDASNHCQTCEIQQISQNLSFEAAVIAHTEPLFLLPQTKDFLLTPNMVYLEANYYQFIFSRPPPFRV